MKAFQSVGEVVNRKVVNQAMEHAQAIADLTGMDLINHDIVGDCSTDVGNRTPKLPRMLHPMAGLQRGVGASEHNFGHLPTAAP